MNSGRDVIVSRRALLQEQKKVQAKQTLDALEVGHDYPATVISTQKYGAFVDVGGGVEGLIHISELAHGRVDRVEDMLSVGESVTVRLLAIQPGEKAGDSPRLRLSLRALTEPEHPEPEKGEVLEGTVTKVSSFGVFVETPKGAGLVPTRELGTPRNSDSRRLFPIGKVVSVVLLSKDPSRGISFSIARVAGVEERHNYREFTRAQKGGTSQASLGSFGELLRQELNLPEPEPKPEPVVAAAAPAVVPAPPAPRSAAKISQPHAAVAPRSTTSTPAPAPAERARIFQEPSTPAKAAPAGDSVIRGRRRPGQADALRESERRHSEGERKK